MDKITFITLIITFLLVLFPFLAHILFKKYSGIFFINFKRIPVYFIISLFVFFFLLNTSFCLKSMYGIVGTEQLIFHLLLERTGANYSIIKKPAVMILIQTVFYFVLSLYVLSVIINLKKQKFIDISLKISKKLFVFFTAILPIAGLVYLVNTVGLPQYIKGAGGTPSQFYEENYIFPNQAAINFPEQKRNLIVIIVESLETGYLTTKDGGAFAEDLMPEVAALAKNNINFSRTEGIGGTIQLYGTEWTTSGIAGYYSGIPLAIRFINQTGWNNFSSIGDYFLPGAYSIGDILYDAGYKSYYIIGSDIGFGGMDKYFNTHKNTIIYDYNYFHKNKYIPNGYNVWWGIEDRKLYELAKLKIIEMPREEPFFITLSTLDTHPCDGYLDDKAERIFDSQFKNVIRDMSKQLSEFVGWLQQQDFYANTTIVILGDHLYHDSLIFPNNFRIQKLNSKNESRYDNTTKSHKRYPMNIFINSLLTPSNVKNRAFSHFDMLPAMIESIGGTFDSEGFALGRSMVNGMTLLEKYGEAEMNRQLRLKSSVYDSFFEK